MDQAPTGEQQCAATRNHRSPAAYPLLQTCIPYLACWCSCQCCQLRHMALCESIGVLPVLPAQCTVHCPLSDST
jgi:hypothetical protein